RQVYEAARVVAYAGDVTWREVGRVLRSRSVRPRLRKLARERSDFIRRAVAGDGRALGGGKPAPERSPLAEGVV
ncbi:hypothetical protein G3I18_33920, partial [Actinospica acidiphila]